MTDAYAVMALDPEYTGACPCFVATIDGTIIEGHCWRVCFDCEGCGIHYEGDSTVAEALKPLFDAMDWYGPWEIREGLRRQVQPAFEVPTIFEGMIG